MSRIYYLDKKDAHFVEHVVEIICNVGSFVRIVQNIDPAEWSREQRSVFGMLEEEDAFKHACEWANKHGLVQKIDKFEIKCEKAQFLIKKFRKHPENISMFFIRFRES